MLVIVKMENGTCFNGDRKDPMEKMKMKERKDNWQCDISEKVNQIQRIHTRARKGHLNYDRMKGIQIA